MGFRIIPCQFYSSLKRLENDRIFKNILRFFFFLLIFFIRIQYTTQTLGIIWRGRERDYYTIFLFFFLLRARARF